MTTPRPLHRCADCQRNTTTGEWCQRGHRYRRGRTQVRCEAFRDELADYGFGFHTFEETPPAERMMIFDRSGGELLIPWAIGHGLDAATRLFREWLEDQVGDHLQRQQERRRMQAIDQRRASFCVVKPEDREP